jgi:hypothetical protein
MVVRGRRRGALSLMDNGVSGPDEIHPAPPHPALNGAGGLGEAGEVGDNGRLFLAMPRNSCHRWMIMEASA